MVTLLAALLEFTGANRNSEGDVENLSTQSLLMSTLRELDIAEDNGEAEVGENTIIVLESQVPAEKEKEESQDLTENEEDNRSKNETTRAMFYASNKVMLHFLLLISTKKTQLTRFCLKMCKVNYKRCRGDSECCSQLCHYDHPELPEGYCKEDVMENYPFS